MSSCKLWNANFDGCLNATLKVRMRSFLQPSWALTMAPNCSGHLPQPVLQGAGSRHPAMTPSGTPVSHPTLHWDVFCVGLLKARINIVQCHFYCVSAQWCLIFIYLFIYLFSSLALQPAWSLLIRGGEPAQPLLGPQAVQLCSVPAF